MPVFTPEADAFLDQLDAEMNAEQKTDEEVQEISTEGDVVDVSEFEVGYDGNAVEVDPVDQASQSDQGQQRVDVSSPYGNIDPVELQKQLYIEQGKTQALQGIFQGATAPSAPAKQEEPDYVFDPASVELTEEEAHMVEHSAPIVRKIAQQIWNEAYKTKIRPLEQQLREQSNNVHQTQQQIQQERAQAFHRLIHREIPDLAQMSATQEFWTYLKQPAPRSGGAWTNEQELTAAITNGNIGAVKEIVSGYKPTQPSGAQAVAPGRPQAGLPPTSAKGSRKLAYSRLLAAEQQHEAGLISSAKYQRIMEIYRDAEFAGNVDYNS